jgi:hypothetical protein
MAPGTFLAIGVAGLVVLLVSAFLGADDADVDADVDLDLDADLDLGTDLDLDTDLDVETDLDVDTNLDTEADGGSVVGGAGHGVASTVLEWFSLKALAVVAVGFGFVGWATSSGDRSSGFVWAASIVTGVALWILAVRLLFPWLKRQQGDDLQPLATYQGLMAEVVVRIPADGVGTVQLIDPSGAVVRRDARSAHRNHEVARGTTVLVVMSTTEHVVVDEFDV